MTQEAKLREALAAVLDTSGARGTYHALKYADAVAEAEALLSSLDRPSREEVGIDRAHIACALFDEIKRLGDEDYVAVRIRNGTLWEVVRPKSPELLLASLSEHPREEGEVEAVAQIRAVLDRRVRLLPTIEAGEEVGFHVDEEALDFAASEIAALSRHAAQGDVVAGAFATQEFAGDLLRLGDWLLSSLGHLADGLADTKSSWADYCKNLHDAGHEKMAAAKLKHGDMALAAIRARSPSSEPQRVEG